MAGWTRMAIGVLVGSLALGRLAEPNGGTVRVAKAPVGPYLVSVWSQPDPPRVGRLDLSVAVMRPATEEALLDARVAVTAEPAGDGAGTRTAVLQPGGGGNPLYYHTLLELPRPGPWRLTVTVDGRPGGGRAAFELDVQPARSGVWALPLGAGIGLGLLWWIASRSRRGGS